MTNGCFYKELRTGFGQSYWMMRMEGRGGQLLPMPSEPPASRRCKQWNVILPYLVTEPRNRLQRPLCLWLCENRSPRSIWPWMEVPAWSTCGSQEPHSGVWPWWASGVAFRAASHHICHFILCFSLAEPWCILSYCAIIIYSWILLKHWYWEMKQQHSFVQHYINCYHLCYLNGPHDNPKNEITLAS